MLTTNFTRSFGVQHPIIQAGMASDCGWRMASAVSNAGGLGTIGSIGRNPQGLRDEIARCREATASPFSVNIATFAWAPFAGEMLEVALAERVPLVTLSFGGVIEGLRKCKAAGVLAAVQVQTMAAAEEVLGEGPDLIIVQGNEAGGHTGPRGTLSFAAQVLEAAGPVPVAVAGGVGNGRGLAAVLAMGAGAAVMGTRFKACEEFGPAASLDSEQKAALVAATGDDTVRHPITDIAIGMTWPEGIAGRVMRNRFTEEWVERPEALRTAVAAEERFGWTAKNNREPDTVLNWAGESAGLVDMVLPAAEIVKRTVAEAEELLRATTAVVK
jgi:nitronate monooxygenase